MLTETGISGESGRATVVGQKARLVKLGRSLPELGFAKLGKRQVLGGKTETDENALNARSGGGSVLVKSFLFCVVLPTFVSVLYYALLASDVYVTEAKLTVRTAPEPQSSSASLSGLTGAVFGKLGLSNGTSSEQDSRIVLDYIKSRAAIHDIGGKEKLAKYYDRPEIDWLSRLDSGESAEEITDYWRERITANVDGLSNILTLRVRAYTPEDAFSLAKELVASSEKLINDVSLRGKQDALARAREEVTRSMSELAEARLRLLAFQQANHSIDPVQSAKQITSVIATLNMQKIKLQAQLAAAGTSGVKDRPGDRYIKARLDVLDQQIKNLENQLTGKDEPSISLQLRDFELLKLRQEFAERMYTLSRASFEEARRKLDKQQLYLAIIVPPLLPEYPLYPRVAVDVGLVFLGCFVFWAICALLVASVKDSTEL